MGKKKVTINKEPLSPTTVGQINTHRFGWIFILIIILLFAGVVYYLPTLSKIYVNGKFSIDPIYDILEEWHLYSRPKTFTTNETNSFNDTTNETYEKYLFENATNVTIDQIKFENIKYEEQVINEINEETFEEYTFTKYIMSFTIENLSDKEVNLENLGYYLEVYSEDNVINSFYVTQIVAAKEKADVQIELDNKVDSYMFSIYKSNVETLLCTNNERKINYLFDESGLKYVEDNNVIYNDNELYGDYYELYNNLMNNNTNENISVSVNEIENGFKYIYKIEYNDDNMKVDNTLYFEKGKTKDDVKTYMEEKKYSCE